MDLSVWRNCEFLFMVNLEEEDVLDTAWFQKQMLRKKYQDKKQDRFDFKFLKFFPPLLKKLKMFSKRLTV